MLRTMGAWLSSLLFPGRQIIRPPKPSSTPQTNLTIAGSSIGGSSSANACVDCRLLVNPRESSSSVKLFRYSPGHYMTGHSKLMIQPSIPFTMMFDRKSVSVHVLSVYHPCPVRIENIQYDAVLCLNDPSSGKGDTVIMIPLQSGFTSSKQGAFLTPIVNSLSQLLYPNPSTNTIEPLNVSVGNSWDVSTLFTVATNDKNQTEVIDPYFTWRHASWSEHVVRDDARAIQYEWRQGPGMTFVMMKEPIQISALSMSVITRLPESPTDHATHPITSYQYTPGRPCLSDKCKPKVTDINHAQRYQENLAEQQKKADATWQAGLGILGVLFGVTLLLLIVYGALRFGKAYGHKLPEGLEWLSDQMGKAMGISSKSAFPQKYERSSPPPETNTIESVLFTENPLNTGSKEEFIKNRKKFGETIPTFSKEDMDAAAGTGLLPRIDPTAPSPSLASTGDPSAETSTRSIVPPSSSAPIESKNRKLSRGIIPPNSRSNRI